jgi:hypothetical protein
VNSALQRARATVARRVPPRTQQAELAALGPGRTPRVGGGICDGERFRLGAVNVLSLRNGRISWIAGFLDPQVHRHFSVPLEMLGPDR